MNPEKIAKILDEHFPNPSPPLDHISAYTLLIAVVLSARCTDARVNQVTPALFALASTPQDMILLSVSRIQDLIRPCGLSPQKARRIFDLSRMLIDEFGGQVPDSLDSLEKLPGVGHKTASVVLVQAFGRPAFPVDTHIYRCARRWRLSSASSVKGVEEDLKKIFPINDWGKIHLQIIYFARSFCSSRAHNIKNCPICSSL